MSWSNSYTLTHNHTYTDRHANTHTHTVPGSRGVSPPYYLHVWLGRTLSMDSPNTHTYTHWFAQDRHIHLYTRTPNTHTHTQRNKQYQPLFPPVTLRPRQQGHLSTLLPPRAGWAGPSPWPLPSHSAWLGLDTWPSQPAGWLLSWVCLASLLGSPQVCQNDL